MNNKIANIDDVSDLLLLLSKHKYFLYIINVITVNKIINNKRLLAVIYILLLNEIEIQLEVYENILKEDILKKYESLIRTSYNEI